MYKILYISIFIILSYGCAKDIEIDRDINYYLQEANNLVVQKKYSQAAKWYEQALLRAESPKDAAKIQLLLGDSYFLSGNYTEAIPVYEAYLDVYRNSIDAKFALVRLGLAYFNIVKYASQDQTNTEKSLQYLSEVKSKYPDLISPYRVEERIGLLRERLAKKEFIIAKYYGRILQRESEILRYKYIITNYNDTIYYAKAVKSLVKVLLKQNKLDDAIEYYNIFDGYSPDRKAVSEVKQLIDKYQAKQNKKHNKENK